MHVLITGAAGGLGRALAVECARRGYRLFLTDRNAQALCHIQDGLCRQFGVQVTAVPCDLTDSASVDAMLDQIDRAQMQFDMLLNVAGLDYEGAFLGCQRENIAQIVALNDAATLRITHAVLQRRSPGRRFFLVFVSSLASLFPMPLKATYAASKRFLLDFATALRQELKEQNAAVPMKPYATPSMPKGSGAASPPTPWRWWPAEPWTGYWRESPAMFPVCSTASS